MIRKLVATVVVGALTFSVWIGVGSPFTVQVNILADAGMSAATHVATCPVRIEPSCRAKALDAGLVVSTYERLRFPVHMRTPGTGRRDVQLPPMKTGLVRDCVEVLDWNDCALVTAASAPAVAAKWGEELPFSKAGISRKCVRQKADAGLLCRRKLPDGGPSDFGDRNVFPASDAVDAGACESVECSVVLGDNPETDL